MRDLIETNRNYFPELEQAAEKLRDELGPAGHDLLPRWRSGCARRHRIVTAHHAAST